MEAVFQNALVRSTAVVLNVKMYQKRVAFNPNFSKSPRVTINLALTQNIEIFCHSFSVRVKKEL